MKSYNYVQNDTYKELWHSDILRIFVRVVDLTTQVYQRKPKQVFLHVSPLLWHLLGSGAAAGGGGNAQLRDATGGLIAALYSQMGPDLLQAASQNSSVTPRMKSLLKDLIENP